MKVEFRTGDICLRERRRRHGTVETTKTTNSSNVIAASSAEDRVQVVAECCQLCEKERAVYMTELGTLQGRYRIEQEQQQQHMTTTTCLPLPAGLPRRSL
ncbi:unnamed protein product [Ectocarpus sp. 8 AP-2014]